MVQESFRRWQARSIDQKQTVSALLIALSGAAIGFSVSQLQGAQQYIGLAQSILFHVQAIAYLVCIATGVAFSLNRVRDFDLTSQIARTRESEPQAPRLRRMRQTVRRWGRITRRMFFAQVVSFCVASAVFLCFIIVRYRSVLYAADSTCG